MKDERVYCAVNKKKEIQWIESSSAKTKFYTKPTYLKRFVEEHNMMFPKDPWRVVKCKITEVKE